MRLTLGVYPDVSLAQASFIFDTSTHILHYDHKDAVRVEVAKPKGSVFVVELPLA